jgi:hypothetical protein
MIANRKGMAEPILIGLGAILPGAAYRWAGAVEVFAQSRGFMPAIKVFSPGPEWGDYEVSFEELKLDGKGVMGIFIGAVTEPGTFTLLVDDVRLK